MRFLFLFALLGLFACGDDAADAAAEAAIAANPNAYCLRGEVTTAGADPAAATVELNLFLVTATTIYGTYNHLPVVGDSIHGKISGRLAGDTLRLNYLALTEAAESTSFDLLLAGREARLLQPDTLLQIPPTLRRIACPRRD